MLLPGLCKSHVDTKYISEYIRNLMFSSIFIFIGDSDSFWGPEYGEHIFFWLEQLEVPFISLKKLWF